MSYKEKGKIEKLAAAAAKTPRQFVEDLVAQHGGKMMKAAMSIDCYPNALRYHLAESKEKTA